MAVGAQPQVCLRGQANPYPEGGQARRATETHHHLTRFCKGILYEVLQLFNVGGRLSPSFLHSPCKEQVMRKAIDAFSCPN